MKRMAAAGILMLSIATSAGAATFDDPEWPCIQRKVPNLSLGQVWAGPLPDEEIEARARDPQIQNIAKFLELRRTPIEQAEARIAEFAEDADEDELTALYLATFQRIDRARARIIDGIGRYARKQAALDDQIDARRREMAELMAAEDPDFDRVDEVEEQLDWDTRIFLDRQQSLTYVCETPVILEQRAFALGRAVMSHLPE